MAMNNKGQALLVGIMIFFMGVVTAIFLIEPLQDMITDSRTVMSCGTSNLTTGVAATCLIVDLYLPYFIGVVLFAAGGLIIYNKIK